MIEQLVRKNIQQLTPYSSARDEFKGTASVFLDANENPFPFEFNRYPDSGQRELKNRIAALKKVGIGNVFSGNGSDEVIDLLIRAFCEPNQDSILVTEPTYGMYEVCAGINAVSVLKVPLKSDFTLNSDLLLQSVNSTTKIIFLCSPNNPSGNLLDRNEIERIIQMFKGLVVVDEAYIDFAHDPGFVPSLSRYPNLVVLQTLSKAWALAGLRLGLGIASAEIVQVLNKIKYPYNISTASQQFALSALLNQKRKEDWVKLILAERENLRRELVKLNNVVHVYPSDANFLLVKITNAKMIYQKLVQHGIVVRDRSSIPGCEDCLRLTIGTPEENQVLLNALKTI